MVGPDPGASTEGWLSEHGLETVHLGLLDASGTIRGKRLGRAAATRAFEQGWRFIDAVQGWTVDDRTSHVGGACGAAVAIDRTSGRPYPFEAGAAIFFGDFDGPSADLSPRVQLARMVERAAACGLAADVGWEFETIVFEDVEALVPAMRENRCWSSLTSAVEAEVLVGLVETLAVGEVPVDHVCGELGPGCLELALEHRPAERSADDAALAKLFTKAYFARRGWCATFMAKVGENFPGLGGHPSLSFVSTGSGRSMMVGAHGGPSDVALAATAGVVTLLPELLAMVTPSPNSFRRLAPGNWAPSSATWGPDNYSCALRVVCDPPAATRLELRIPGADVSPHLCLAMFLGAAVWGIERGLEPPPPIVPPCDGREVAGTARLPRSLPDALDAFVESRAACELFGPAFVQSLATSGRMEDEACRRIVPSHERTRYLDQV